jgi:glycosyltransferase involved in cell wall biosynthesis
MKIAIVPDTAEGCAGMDRYARELTTQLIESQAVEEIVLAHSENWAPRAQPRVADNQSQKVSELLLPLPHCPFGKELRQLFIAPFVLDRRCSKKTDIVHDLHHFAPFLLSFGDYKKVVTVHDFTPLVTRWLHPRSRRMYFYVRYLYVLPLILRRAHIIIAISNNTKKDLEKYLGITSDKIRVVYHGIDKNYKPTEDIEKLGETKSKYGLSFPFILGQATWAPSENVAILIEAFRQMRTDVSDNGSILGSTKLVFFGHYNAAILSEVRRLGLQNEIVFLGYVPESDLPVLYSAARVFVYPSLYDGFGFPPLEAMACGAPSIVSNVASLPEVVGDGGLMFDPVDAVDLAGKMRSLLLEEDIRSNLAIKGLERAKEFTWERTAAETLKVYSELLEPNLKR